MLLKLVLLKYLPLKEELSLLIMIFILKLIFYLGLSKNWSKALCELLTFPIYLFCLPVSYSRITPTHLKYECVVIFMLAKS